MAIFRDENEKRVGLGTYVLGGPSEEYVIVQTGPCILAALEISTSRIVDGSQCTVGETDWITRTEFDQIFLFKNYTQSDYSFVNDWNIACAKP